MNAQVKELIVNGRLNRFITAQEIRAFPKEKVTRALYNALVEMQGRGPDGLALQLPTYQQLTVDPYPYIDDILAGRRECEQRARERMAADEYKQGAQLRQAMTGMALARYQLQLTPHQARGYLSKLSSWNDFSSSALANAITAIEGLGIVKDYGFNNPNTGRPCTSWEVLGPNSDYWNLLIEIHTQATYAQVCKCRPLIERTLAALGADSVTYDELIGAQTHPLEVRFKLFWD